MRSLLRFPLRALEVAWSLINPSRTAGRIPLGRFTIVVSMVAALIFLGYTAAKKSIRLPLSSDPFVVEVIFSDAKGLDALDEPAAAIAGTPLGRVTDVRYEDGRAVAELTFDPDVEGKIFADASAVMRPASALQNLTVNIDPGTPAAGPLSEGDPIDASRSEGYVSLDELTRLLDVDTQAQVQILISEAARALHNREGELRDGLRELGRLTESAAPISRALASRRRLLTRLVGDLDAIFTTVGRRGAQLAEAVDAANHTLEVTASRDTELSELTRELAPTLVETQRTLAASRRLAEPLIPALKALLPIAGPLADGLVSLRGSLPLISRFIDRLGVLTLEGRRPLALLLRASAGLRATAQSQIGPVGEFLTLTRILNRYKSGVAQTADTLSGALSVQDRGGPYAQNDFLRFEQPLPENLGFPASAARSIDGGPSRMELALSRALEGLCRDDVVFACVSRFQIPGLPREPVSGADGGEG